MEFTFAASGRRESLSDQHSFRILCSLGGTGSAPAAECQKCQLVSGVGISKQIQLTSRSCHFVTLAKHENTDGRAWRQSCYHDSHSSPLARSCGRGGAVSWGEGGGYGKVKTVPFLPLDRNLLGGLPDSTEQTPAAVGLGATWLGWAGPSQSSHNGPAAWRGAP